MLFLLGVPPLSTLNLTTSNSFLIFRHITMSKMSKNQFEEFLICEVQKHPILYDLKNHEYRNTTLKETVWEQIAGTVGNKKTAQDCSSRWKSLRSQYLAYLNKLSMPTGSGAKGHKTFRHSGLMKFVKDDNNDDDSSNLTNVKKNSLQTDNDAEDDLFDDDADDVIHVDNLPEGSEVIQTFKIGETPRAHKKFGDKRKLQPFEEELIKAVKESPQQPMNTPVDEFELFGKMIAIKIRKIDASDSLRATEVQIKIQQFILEALSKKNETPTDTN